MDYSLYTSGYCKLKEEYLEYPKLSDHFIYEIIEHAGEEFYLNHTGLLYDWFRYGWLEYRVEQNMMTSLNGSYEPYDHYSTVDISFLVKYNHEEKYTYNYDECFCKTDNEEYQESVWGISKMSPFAQAMGKLMAKLETRYEDLNEDQIFDRREISLPYHVFERLFEMKPDVYK